jgi:hypothetical protein
MPDNRKVAIFWDYGEPMPSCFLPLMGYILYQKTVAHH